MTTDEYFKALPNWVQTEGEMYHFGMIKGLKRIIIWYRTEKGEYLKDTCRSGDDLFDACRKMYDWLVKYKYIEPIQNDTKN